MGMFKTAKALVAPASKTTKGPKKDEIQIDGLKAYADVDAMIKMLTAVKETLGEEIKNTGFDLMFATAQDTGKRPESFRGVDGIASASVEMRKRGTNSVLKDEEVTAFTEAGFTVESQIVVPHLFAINPKYAGDTKMLDSVEKALKNKVPQDFIMVQEEVSKPVVTDNLSDAVFAALKSPKSKVTSSLVKMTTTMALKPKLETTDVSEILKAIEGLVVA
jgi:hypothetical protein